MGMVINPVFRMLDGPDALLRTGPKHPRVTKPGARVDGTYTRTRDGKESVSTGDHLHDSTAYLMRQRSHLYDDTERDTILDWRQSLSERADLFDLDCHRCKRAVFAPDLDSTCPRCTSPLTCEVP